MDDVPVALRRGNGPLKICAGSAGNPMKGYDYLYQVIGELQAEGVLVELEILSQLSNKECLERKQECQVTFTSLHGAWGISGVESMWLGHVVMSCLGPWIMSHYSDNPTVLICKENLKQKIKMLAALSDAELQRWGKETKTFARRNFSTKTILKRYLYLFDLIMNRDEYLDGCKNPKFIYDDF
jgi:hypothetical protein